MMALKPLKLLRLVKRWQQKQRLKQSHLNQRLKTIRPLLMKK